MNPNSDNSNNDDRWLFKSERLGQCPSILRGMTEAEELTHRQTAACLIRQIGSKLRETCKRPSGLCMDTAMVFMHRFYVFHSFQDFPAHTMAPCALFLAAKCEETPIKLEYVIRTSHMLNNPNAPQLDTKEFEKLQKELIANENLLLQTLGFELIIYHPHTSVIQCGDLVGAPKLITKLAYELATNSLHFSTMCLRYKPTIVACICLNMAFKSMDFSPARPQEGQEWWYHLNKTITAEDIDRITLEFVGIIKAAGRAFQKWVSVKNQRHGH